MINYSLLEIRRVIMHRILPKTAARAHVEVESNNHIIPLTNEIKSLLISRLVDSCGRQGKAFELTIEKDDQHSCFNKVKDLTSLAEQAFIDRSIEIAQLLADSQDSRISVPGGYFLLVEACTRNRSTNVYVILKAERQDALNDLGNSVQAVQNIFLSPAQKMYKAGVFQQISDANPLTKKDFTAYLFDSQFNDGTKLAEYFYKDFLGLSIEGNWKVQTKMFYDLFNETTDSLFKKDIENRNNCRDLLRTEMMNQNGNLHAHEAINRIVPLDYRDKYIAKVGSKFPTPFIKDIELIQGKLSHKSVLLTGSIRLLAPTESFNNQDIVIETSPDDPRIKIVKIRIDGNEDNA